MSGRSEAIDCWVAVCYNNPNQRKRNRNEWRRFYRDDTHAQPFQMLDELHNSKLIIEFLEKQVVSPSVLS